MVSASANKLEEVAPNITLERLVNERINVFKFNTIAHASLTLWADKVTQMMAKAPLDDPFIFIQDLTFDKAVMTPTLRGYMKQLADYRPDLQAYIAIVLPNTLLMQVSFLFTHSMYRKNRIIKAFPTKEEALAWTRSLL